MNGPMGQSSRSTHAANIRSCVSMSSTISTVRCKLPQQERFRLAIVDGFAGGGRYQCGTPGSPLIFIEELKRAVEAVNTQRAVQGLGAVESSAFSVSTMPVSMRSSF